MGMWTKQASGLPRGLRHHPWTRALTRAIEDVEPALADRLRKMGDLDAYVLVKVDAALRSMQEMLAAGTDEQTAKELTLADLMPQEPEPAEEYELEGAAEDEAAALEDFLGGL